MWRVVLSAVLLFHVSLCPICHGCGKAKALSGPPSQQVEVAALAMVVLIIGLVVQAPECWCGCMATWISCSSRLRT